RYNQQAANAAARYHAGKGGHSAHDDFSGETIQPSTCSGGRVRAPNSYVHEGGICSEGEACTRQYGESELDTVRLRTTIPGNCNLVIARWSVRRGRDRQCRVGSTLRWGSDDAWVQRCCYSISVIREQRDAKPGDIVVAVDDTYR